MLDIPHESESAVGFFFFLFYLWEKRMADERWRERRTPEPFLKGNMTKKRKRLKREKR